MARNYKRGAAKGSGRTVAQKYNYYADRVQNPMLTKAQKDYAQGNVDGYKACKAETIVFRERLQKAKPKATKAYKRGVASARSSFTKHVFRK